MSDRPIPFSGPMVQALLDGRKTQTRRVLNPQPSKLYGSMTKVDNLLICRNTATGIRRDIRIPYAAGDRLWVREAWKTDRHYDDLPPSHMGGDEPLIYMAENTVQRWGGKPDAMSRWGRFRQGMHMPRWASRLTLTVTDVRVQRVQEISDEDAEAEGVDWKPGYRAARVFGENAATRSFETLWDSLNASRGFGWHDNPFVAAYTFTVEKRNIDADR